MATDFKPGILLPLNEIEDNDSQTILGLQNLRITGSINDAGMPEISFTFDVPKAKICDDGLPSNQIPSDFKDRKWAYLFFGSQTKDVKGEVPEVYLFMIDSTAPISGLDVECYFSLPANGKINGELG